MRYLICYAKNQSTASEENDLPWHKVLCTLKDAKLANYLEGLFRNRNENVFCLNDSQVVVHWIKPVDSIWKSFMANRIHEI